MFKVGDVVAIKSGGPAMTVVALEGGFASDGVTVRCIAKGYVGCQWFVFGEPKSAMFLEAALAPAVAADHPSDFEKRMLARIEEVNCRVERVAEATVPKRFVG